MSNILERVSSFGTELYQDIIKWIKGNWKKFLPYAVFFFAAMYVSYIIFKPGYYEGHDTAFHHPQVYSYYESLLKGDFLGYISPVFYNNFGLSVRLFYSTLPHTVTAVLGVIIHPFGLSLTSAFKIVNFLTFFLGGVFAYRLGLALFKGHKGLAIILGLAYLAWPYKFTTVYVRQAFAENFASTFIPLFFLAIYRILDEKPEEITPKPYILVMVSTILLMLSHYITALYTVIFGVLYVILRLPRLLRKITKPRFLGYMSLAVLAVIILFLPKGAGIISERTDAVNLRLFLGVQGTTAADVINRIGDSTVFFNCGYTLTGFEACVGFMGIGALVAIIIRLLKPQMKYLPIGIIILSALAPVVGIYKDVKQIGLALFLLAFAIVATIAIIKLSKENKCKNKVSYFEIGAWAIMTVLTFLMLYTEQIWKIIPEVFSVIQFPFRLWTYAGLFISVTVLLIIHKLMENVKYIKYVLPIIAVTTLNTANVRTNWITPGYNEANVVEKTDIDSMYAAGWQLEYLSEPFGPSGYLPKGSFLYKSMRTVIWNNFKPIVRGKGLVQNYYCNEIDEITLDIVDDGDEAVNGYVVLPVYYYNGDYSVMAIDGETVNNLTIFPSDGMVAFRVNKACKVVVKQIGDADISLYTPYIYDSQTYTSNYTSMGNYTDYKYNSIDGANFTITSIAQDEVTVQMPLFFYEGYKVTLTTDEGTKTLKNYSQDGLLSFNVNEVGKIKVEFVGTIAIKVTTKLAEATILIMVITTGLYFFYLKPRKKLIGPTKLSKGSSKKSK